MMMILSIVIFFFMGITASSKSKKLSDEAINDDMKTIVKRISGGLTNYPSRLRYYELAKKFSYKQSFENPGLHFFTWRLLKENLSFM